MCTYCSLWRFYGLAETGQHQDDQMAVVFYTDTSQGTKGLWVKGTHVGVPGILALVVAGVSVMFCASLFKD